MSISKLAPSLILIATLLLPFQSVSAESNKSSESTLSLITESAEEGFQLAIHLSRLGVTETQGNREVLFAGRAEYSEDADSLIAASQVIAIHFQTIAAANDYWHPKSKAKDDQCSCEGN
ncbi:MAG: hexameric tyrosine-coordinated heme protein [Opitutales bacterium]|nr:hexameric tyrosine-coordinated heme protein [Opitutales bacterium]